MSEYAQQQFDLFAWAAERDREAGPPAPGPASAPAAAATTVNGAGGAPLTHDEDERVSRR
jgi:hypothetical protein